MNLSAVNAYKEPISQGSNATSTNSTLVNRTIRDDSGAKLNAKSGANSGNTVITKKEREFFIKLFPDNSTQIEKHELFNRNGKITRQSFSKGAIVDWTV